MIYVNHDLETWLQMFPKLIIKNGECDGCQEPFSTCIPFIGSKTAGLISPECPCEKQTNDLVSYENFEDLSMYKWDEILREGFSYDIDNFSNDLDNILNDWYVFNEKRFEEMEELDDSDVFIEDMKGFQLFEVNDQVDGIIRFYLAKDINDILMQLIARFGERDAADMIAHANVVPFLRFRQYEYINLERKQKYTFTRLVKEILEKVEDEVSCVFVVSLFDYDADWDDIDE